MMSQGDSDSILTFLELLYTKQKKQQVLNLEGYHVAQKLTAILDENPNSIFSPKNNPVTAGAEYIILKIERVSDNIYDEGIFTVASCGTELVRRLHLWEMNLYFKET